MASPERPQLEILSFTEENKSCGGNFAFSSKGLPPLASSFDCCSTYIAAIILKQKKIHYIGIFKVSCQKQLKDILLLYTQQENETYSNKCINSLDRIFPLELAHQSLSIRHFNLHPCQGCPRRWFISHFHC